MNRVLKWLVGFLLQMPMFAVVSLGISSIAPNAYLITTLIIVILFCIGEKIIERS